MRRLKEGVRPLGLYIYIYIYIFVFFRYFYFLFLFDFLIFNFLSFFYNFSSVFLLAFLFMFLSFDLAYVSFHFLKGQRTPKCRATTRAPESIAGRVNHSQKVLYISGRSKVTRVTVGRDRNQSFRVCKVNLATLKVAKMKKEKILILEGRTPPFRRLICFCSGAFLTRGALSVSSISHHSLLAKTWNQVPRRSRTGRSSHNFTLNSILRKFFWVTGAVWSQVLFPLDTIRIEQQRRGISFLVAFFRCA